MVDREDAHMATATVSELAALWAGPEGGSNGGLGDEEEGPWPVRAANPVFGVPAPTHAHAHQLPAPKELHSKVQVHVEAARLVAPVSKRPRPNNAPRERAAPLPARTGAGGGGVAGGAAWLRCWGTAPAEEGDRE